MAISLLCQGHDRDYSILVKDQVLLLADFNVLTSFALHNLKMGALRSPTSSSLPSSALCLFAGDRVSAMDHHWLGESETNKVVYRWRTWRSNPVFPCALRERIYIYIYVYIVLFEHACISFGALFGAATG